MSASIEQYGFLKEIELKYCQVQDHRKNPIQVGITGEGVPRSDLIDTEYQQLVNGGFDDSGSRHYGCNSLKTRIVVIRHVTK